MMTTLMPLSANSSICVILGWFGLFSSSWLHSPRPCMPADLWLDAKQLQILPCLMLDILYPYK